jgi:selenocysteine lyase/cysteine desulfurase
VLALGDRLIAGLDQLGLEVMSPRDSQRRGASLSFAHPEPQRIGRALAKMGIHVWSGDGRVRASTHVFNDEDDVAHYLEALRTIVQGGEIGVPAEQAVAASSA